MFKTLITPDQLVGILDSDKLVIVDCRFSLADTFAGQEAYQEAHLPNAVYAHLDEDLSGEIIPGTTGRHPLPKVDTFSKQLSRWGIDADTQVVCYDDKGGAIASRLWWMLQWLGHEKVAVLEGGIQAWQAQNHPLTDEITQATARQFKANPQKGIVVDATFVEKAIESEEYLILDARAAERYRGEHEPIDPIAGHIATAISAPFTENWDKDKNFLSKKELQNRFEKLLDGQSPESCIVYCGSGVTACHNILAMRHAGMEMPILYAGSWSDWITKEGRKVVTS